MTINWDDFAAPSGDFNRWKPENPGDSVSGKIKAVRIATMPDGNKYPALTITTNDGDREVLASQTMLLRLLAEKKPKIGDGIGIRYEKEERLPNGRTLKHFTVNVKVAEQPNADDLI